MKLVLAFINLLIISELCLLETGAQSFDEFFIKSVPGSIKEDVKQVFVPPSNTNDSIQYTLYTRENPKNACFMEPTPEEFDHCPFDPNLDTKILIHGFVVTPETFKVFMLIKDKLLSFSSYNVILVDWSRYNGHPYNLAVSNTIPVGKKVAEFIKFIKRHTGARYSSFHLIGHSLGAHVSGIVGKNICSLGRITGLDPAGPLYDLNDRKQQLDYTDAKCVDVIHTSDEKTVQGLGKFEPLGHLDFYPNGGRLQKEACSTIEEDLLSMYDIKSLESPYYTVICSHVLSAKFFLHSISDCDYLSTKCDNYESLPTCSSKRNPTARLGFFAECPKDLPEKSQFFLKTNGNSPFC